MSLTFGSLGFNQAGAEKWAARNGIGLRRIAIGVLGQSNEHGQVAAADRAAYPQAFQSLRNPGGIMVPLGPAVNVQGGWWPKVYDDLYDWGYDAQIVNGAIGGMSFLTQAANVLQSWNAGAAYYASRPAAGGGDRGDYGDLMRYQTGGDRIFQCVGGRTRAAINYGPLLNPQGLQTVDSINLTGAQQSGATAPAGFSTANVGDVIADNGISWKCVSVNGIASGPWVSTSLQNGVNIIGPKLIGYGFDPLGILQRLHEEMQRVQGVTRKIIYIQNGQSDLGTSSTGYSAVMQAIGTFFLDRGYEVMFGLTIYSPGSANNTPTNYGNLWTGVQSAVAALSAVSAYSGRVWTGKNLYAAMGTTGPMAAGGAFLQSDNIHLNGAGSVGPDISGVSCAGRHVADALKLALPKITLE